MADAKPIDGNAELAKEFHERWQYNYEMRVGPANPATVRDWDYFDVGSATPEEVDQYYELQDAKENSLIDTIQEMWPSKESSKAGATSHDSFELPAVTVTANRIYTWNFFGIEVSTENIHQFLDWIGMVPGVAIIAGGADSVIYFVEGKYSEALLASLQMIPGAKWFKFGTNFKVVLPGIKESSKAENLAQRSVKAPNIPKSIEHLTDGAKMSTNAALDEASSFLGKGYKDMGGGRFVSADGTRQVRLGDSDILGKHAGGSHINFEVLKPNPDKPGKMLIEKTIHIFIE